LEILVRRKQIEAEIRQTTAAFDHCLKDNQVDLDNTEALIENKQAELEKHNSSWRTKLVIVKPSRKASKLEAEMIKLNEAVVSKTHIAEQLQYGRGAVLQRLGSELVELNQQIREIDEEVQERGLPSVALPSAVQFR
jgi:hypothetical protein